MGLLSSRGKISSVCGELLQLIEQTASAACVCTVRVLVPQSK